MKNLIFSILMAYAFMAQAESGFIAGQLPAVDQTATPAAPSVPVSEVARGACNRPKQAGCWDLGVLNIVQDPQVPYLARLEEPAWDQTERARRIDQLGPKTWEGLVTRKVKASTPHGFLIMVWNVGQGNPTGYRINGCDATDRQKGCKSHKTDYAKVMELTGNIRPLNFDQTVVKLSNVPDRAFLIKADGADAWSATLQFPVGMLDPQRTHILICAEDGTPLYPSKERNEGLWGVPVTLAHLIELEAKGSFAVFSFPPVANQVTSY